jgi:hypothetical protein
MKQKAKRFKDEGQRIEDFSDEFLVRCPRCAGCARVVPKDSNFAALFSPQRLVCPCCGYGNDWCKHAIHYQDRHDWYFELPLWLQTECCGHVLWAHNEKHLTFLEDYVQSVQRRRTPNQNRSLASRLPTWLKSKKNRQEVIKGLKHLRGRLQS